MKKETVVKIVNLIALAAVCFTSFIGCAIAEGDKPIVSGNSAPPESDIMDSNLKSLSELLLLSETDAKQYSSNLQNLIGQYYQIVTVDGHKALQPLGRALEDMKVDKLELKDKVIFKKVIDKNYNSGINIPWLDLTAKDDEKIETLIQDIASVSAPSSAAFIHNHLPSRDVINPSLPVYYVSAATVTIISQKLYSSKNIAGSIPIVNIGGAQLYSKDIFSNAWIVSVSKTLAWNPIDNSSGRHRETNVRFETLPSSSNYDLRNSNELYKEDASLNGLVVPVLQLNKK